MKTYRLFEITNMAETSRDKPDIKTKELGYFDSLEIAIEEAKKHMGENRWWYRKFLTHEPATLDKVDKDLELVDNQILKNIKYKAKATGSWSPTLLIQETEKEKKEGCEIDKEKLRFLRLKGKGIIEKSDNITFTSQRIGENDLNNVQIFDDFLFNKETFTKNDQDKIQPLLIEPEFIEGMAKVLTIGAKKYSKYNWKKCKDKDRYKDALLRHILAYLKGEEKDKETGLSHLHHAACNLMFLEFMK